MGQGKRGERGGGGGGLGELALWGEFILSIASSSPLKCRVA